MRRDPGSRLFAQLAEEERKAGDLKEAIRVARAGLAVYPAYPAALLTLGRALIESGDGEGARSVLQEALKQAPDNILANRFLGQALEAVGELEGAIGQYRATLMMAPGDRELESRLQSVSRQAAARAAAARATAVPAHTGPAQAAGATVASAPAGAMARPEPGAAVGPQSGEAPPFSSSTLAELYLRQGFAERAFEVYRQVVAERPADERARQRLSEIGSLLAVGRAGAAGDVQDGRRRALQRTIAGLEVLLGVARRR